MEHPLSQSYFHFDSTDSQTAPSTADVQSLSYSTLPLSQLDKTTAIELCNKLYGPEERFAQGFYLYHKDVMHLPEKEAWQATLDELQMYVDTITHNLDDPRMHTVGFEQNGTYTPVGIFGLRPLSEHETGRKLLETIEAKGMQADFPGNLSIAHSYSALNGYRNRALMKFVFVMIALRAIEDDFQHIFFFMSDYRLGPIYERYGLAFPPNLRFADSQHLVGCYSLNNTHLQDIRQAAMKYGHSVLQKVEALIPV